MSTTKRAAKSAAPSRSKTPKRDAAVAEVEQTDGRPTVEWRGHTFRVPRADDVPKSVNYSFRRLRKDPSNVDHALDLLEAFLGPEQFSVMEDEAAAERDGWDAEFGLLNAILEQAYGADLGESSASSES